jgi:hypothetical protein
MKLELPLAPLSRRLTIGWWVALAILFAALSAAIWPKPYVFHVSQLVPVGVEEVDGQVVKLDNWEDGYTKLHAFQNKRQAVVLLAAAAAASVVLALAAAIFARDTSWRAWLAAIPAAALAMWSIERALPPVFDPVYGTGFQHFFPWWIELAALVVVATLAVAPLFLLRWLLGRLGNRAVKM